MKSRKRRAVAPRQAVSRNSLSSRHRYVLAAGALSAAALLSFSNSFTAGFVLDNKFLLSDPQIRTATGANVSSIFQHSYWWPLAETGLYRPFTTLSYLFNYAVLGDADQPAGYHWINFLLHTGNVLLVYALSLRLVRKFWPSVFIAGIWAVHPALTESVTNIVGRADLLAAMATLGGFLMYLKSVDTAGWRRAGWLAGLLAITALGVFSKESAVVIPGVIMLYELTCRRERGRWKALLLGLFATLVPIAIMLYARSTVLAAAPSAELPFVDNPIAGAGFWRGQLTALVVFVRYLWLIIWPNNLSSDYSYAQIHLAHGSMGDWLAWLVVLALVLIVVRLYRHDQHTPLFLAGFAFLAFLPVSNLLFPIGTIMAERLLYLPSVGLVACLVLAIYAATGRTVPPAKARQVASVLLCLVATLFAMRTWNRNRDWQNDLTMATASVEGSPDSFKTHRLLATVLFESGRSDSSLDHVIDEADKSVALLDPLPDVRNNSDTYRLAGGYHLLKGDLIEQRAAEQKSGVSPEAAQSYRTALGLLLRCIAIGKSGGGARGDTEAYQMLSATYARLGDRDQAYHAATEALHLHPSNPQAYRQIAYVFLSEDKTEDAAFALIKGSLILNDAGLVKDAAALFEKRMDRCATVAGADGPVINPECEIVRKYFCAASAEVIQAQLQAGRRDLALEQKQSFVKDYGCARDPLDRLLAER